MKSKFKTFVCFTGLAFFQLFFGVSYINASIQAFSGWTVQNWNTVPGNYFGNWVFSEENTVATQTLNSNPSVLLNNEDKANYSMQGFFRVDTVTDDDFIGFVFGYQNSNNFYLFNWKQGDQTGSDGTISEAGFCVKKFSSPEGTILTNDDFSGVVNTANMEILASKYGSNYGWDDYKIYGFNLCFSSGTFQITITDGATTLWDVTINDDSFTSGQFGIYNNSQPSAVYFNLEEGLSSCGAPDLTASWEQIFDGNGLDRAYRTAIDSENNVIVTGEANNYQDYCTIKYATDGSIRWIRTYDSGNQDRARDVAVDSRNNIIVSGIVTGPDAGQNDRNHTVIKYDANGAVLWMDSHSSLSPTSHSSHVAVDSEDNIISTRAVEITKYNSNGEIIWDKTTWMGAWGQYFNVLDVAVDSWDNILITGAIYLNNGSYWYFATAKYSPEGGMIWAKYDPATQSSSRSGLGRGITADSFDNVISTGRSADYNMYTLKYTPDGSVLWARTSENATGSNCVAVDSFDNILVTGYGKGIAQDAVYILKYSQGGDVIHDTIYQSRNSQSSDKSFSNGIIIDRSGDTVITGWFMDGTDKDEKYLTVKLSESRQPVADAGNDQSVNVGGTVTLDGSTSWDPDGDPVTFSWAITSTPSGSMAVLDDPASVNPSFTADIAGTYIASLTVNDGAVDSDPDTVTISTINVAPIADAGNDQSVNVGGTVTLDGSTSWDPDGDPVTFSWAITSTPSGSMAVLDDPASVNPSFTADVAGTYVASLTVNDGTVGSDPDTVTISTINVAPIAGAGDDQSVNVGGTVTLDGSTSWDPDGDLVTFSWAITSTPSGSMAVLDDPASVNPSFTADVAGTYVSSLTVNDGTVGSDPDTVTISTINVAPIADAGDDQSVNVGNVVTLDGSTSWDPDGDPVTFSWAFTSTPSGSTAVLDDPASVNPSFTADIAGTYIASLTVNDGAVDSDPDTVTISTINVAPIADAGDDQSVNVGGTVTLDGSTSWDPDGDPVTFSWAITSTPSGSTAVLDDPASVNPSFIADIAGTYVASLTVNDGTVGSDPDKVTISAVTHQTEAISKVQDGIIEINEIDPETFKNPNNKKTLTSKLSSVIEKLDNGEYQDALKKLENDILRKIDGCALTGSPDKNDWIKDCDSQAAIYPLVVDVIELLKQLI